ncbi:MAG: glycosyltransferase family 4 protein [Persephonella sp.]|nr:glycosyltransferase family 4 protein [Persephonella sp.]
MPVLFYKPEDSYLRKKYNIPTNRIILVYAGRISVDKNILDLAKIYNILSFFKPEKYHLVVIGSGHLENKFFKKLKGNFTYLGYIKDKKEYAEVLSACDIFITTSKIETFGLSLVEAQACGLPVVAYKSSSIPEVVYNKELLAESYDDFVKNVEIASNYYLQKSKRHRLSEEIRKSFLWEKTFKNLVSVYREISLDNNVLQSSPSV